MKNKTKLNVCILFGGRSVEHDISIISGIQVINALNKDKYQIKIIYITKDNKMLMSNAFAKLETFKNGKELQKGKEVTLCNIKDKTYIKQRKRKYQIDVFIPVLHGKGTEDGTISALLDFYNATYITSNHTASSISQDKTYTKDILRKKHLPTPRYVHFTANDDYKDIIKTVEQKLLYPVIIKPNTLGSSIGIKIVYKKDELAYQLKDAFKYDDNIIIEEVIKNVREFNCACFKYNNKFYLSNIEEVTTKNDILTFDDKYIENIKTSSNNSRIIPAKISGELTNKIKDMTQDIYETLNHKGVVRIDYLYDNERKHLYFNEINTIPGSYAFYLFDSKSLTFEIILDLLIKEALLNKQKEAHIIKQFVTNVLQNKNKILKK